METILKNLLVDASLLQPMGTYWRYLAPDFAAQLNQYLPIFEQYRADVNAATSKEDWHRLPYGSNNAQWKWRRQSLAMLNRQIDTKRFCQVLEIGAWNGWLTKKIAQRCDHVVAADYFTHPFDGIGQIASFADNIHALQCDLSQINRLFKTECFDLIVVNHCLSYTKNPVEFIKNLIPLLNSQGVIISLGNTFYRNPKKKIMENEIFAQRFAQQYHLGVFIRPVKGFMDQTDINELSRTGCTIQPYPKKYVQNFYARWNAAAPQYIAIIYQKNERI